MNDIELIYDKVKDKYNLTLTNFYTFWSLDPRRECRLSHKEVMCDVIQEKVNNV